MKSATRCWSVFGGAGNVDEVNFPDQGFAGLTVRLRDVATGDWSIYWANSRDGILGAPPVTGRFETASDCSTPTRCSTAGRSGCASPGRTSPPTPPAGSRRSRPTAGKPGGQLDGGVHPPAGRPWHRMRARPRLTGKGAAGRLAGSQNHLKATLAERKCQTERGADHGTDRVHRRGGVRRDRRRPVPGEVVVDGDRIRRGPLRLARGPRGRRGWSNIAGCTIMPGLIESHAHLTFPSAVGHIDPSFNPPLDVSFFRHIEGMEAELARAERNAGILLDAGFTSAYSAGSLLPDAGRGDPARQDQGRGRPRAPAAAPPAPSATTTRSAPTGISRA